MNAVPLWIRVNRLFELAHDPDSPEAEVDTVAEGVSEILGRPVTPSEIAALRRSDHQPAEPEVLRALARYFHAPERYLGTESYLDIDTLIRFKIAVRDAGVQHLSMRSIVSRSALTTTEMESLIPLLEGLHRGDQPHTSTVTRDMCSIPPN